MTSEILYWCEVPPEFGAALPNGSCNAYVRGEWGEGLCGFPRRKDGVCLAGHPTPKD